MDELQERLRRHAKSLDGLLSLIPAKQYYGEDVSDQWKRKKQTPEQKKAARIAKLDPDNWKSAKDATDERGAAAKRKWEEEEDEQRSDVDFLKQHHIQPEKPKVMQDQHLPKAKKPKIEVSTDQNLDLKKQRRVEKKAAKQEKRDKQKAKRERQQARKHADVQRQLVASKDDEALSEAEAVDAENIPQFDLDFKAASQDDESTSSSTELSNLLSPPAESHSSTSSAPLPVSEVSRSKRSTDITSSKETDIASTPSLLPSPPRSQAPSLLSASERELAKERLQTQLSSLRAARKADAKPRSRQELLDLRRRKEEAGKLARKEQRRKEKEEESQRQDEEIERRFSPGGSGSLIGSPRSPPVKADEGGGNAFSFGRIEFGDGKQWDPHSWSGVSEKQKFKGPQDVQTAYNLARTKEHRIAGLDEQKRKEIEEKDMWLNAKRRAHGDKVRDNTSLLKKALKREQGRKKKSEKEWNGRLEGVQKAQEARQKKRTDNLAKRKDEKKRGKGTNKRPGFEGSFRGRTGGRKK